MKILGYDYRLVLGPDQAEMKASGRFSNDDMTITVAVDLPYQLMVSTVLHELIHGIADATDVKLSESQIIRLETGLYQALIANGVKLDPLVAELKGKIKMAKPRRTKAQNKFRNHPAAKVVRDVTRRKSPKKKGG